MKLLACFQFICLVCGLRLPGNKPVVVCNVQLHSEMDEPFRAQLAKCDYIVMCDDTCDRSNPALPYRGTDSGDKLSRLKDSAQHATFMLSFAVNPFELQGDEGGDRFCHEIEHCLEGDLYGGIDLDCDPTMLDAVDQTNYARFLKKLRRQLNPSVIISTTIGALRLEPGPMVEAFIETLNFIVISRDETPSNNDHAQEFVLRKYPISVIDNMLDVGFPPEKIVLGLKTAGVVTNPAYEKEQYFKKCSKIGLIPYGQVCELRDQSKRFCSWRHDHRCLIFDGHSKVVYDNSETAKERGLQCTKRKLKGVSVQLNQDDDTGICGENKFPLMNAIVEVFDKYSDEECPVVDKVKDDRKTIEEDRLSTELTRLERAIENIEKLTGFLQKIVSFLFRTMDKAIDFVTGKQTVDNPKKADPELEKVDAGSNVERSNMEDSENVESGLKSVQREEVEAIRDEVFKNITDVSDTPLKDMVQNPILEKVGGGSDLGNVEPGLQSVQREEIVVIKDNTDVLDIPPKVEVQKPIDNVKDGLKLI